MESPESLALFSIVATVVLSFAYFAVLEKIYKAANEDKQHITRAFFKRKIIGFIMLGMIPAIAALVLFGLTPSVAGFVLGSSMDLWPWVVSASVLFILLNLFNSRNPQVRAVYPEMRRQVWDAGSFGLAAGGWILYLTGYEFLFRGLLLFSCLEAFGLWPAVVINLALYAALHLPKGLKEATAAIPFGALLCYLTLESGSIVPAIIIHSVQAVSCEFFCLLRNPEMKFNLIKS